MAKQSGACPGADRPQGAKTKTGQELREAAQAYTHDALETLAGIMQDEDAPHAARANDGGRCSSAGGD